MRRKCSVRGSSGQPGADHNGAHTLTGAIAGAGPDDVIVVANGGRIDVSSWGGIVSLGAAVRSVRGVITDGACRDMGQARELRCPRPGRNRRRPACLAQNYPLFSRGRFMRTGKDRVRLAAIGTPVTVSGIEIQPGALVCADADGVVAVPAAEAERITETAECL